MSFLGMSYVKETIKTELNCQASGKTNLAVFQMKVTQGRHYQGVSVSTTWVKGKGRQALRVQVWENRT